MGDTSDGAVPRSPALRCQVDRGARGDYYWRLTALNGRVVAMSVARYPDVTSCQRAFEQVCAERAELSCMVLHAQQGNGWVWTARSTDGTSLARSSRAYQRYSTCQTAYERFHTLLAEITAAEPLAEDDLA